MNDQFLFRFLVSLLLLNVPAWSDLRSQEVKIPNELIVPVSGVRLTGGILKKTFDQNIAYLLNNYPEDNLLYPFRQRAGNAKPAGTLFKWDHLPPKVTVRWLATFSWDHRVSDYKVLSI